MVRGKLKFSLAVTAILLAVGYLIYSGISQTGVYYHTVSEVLDRASVYDGQNLRISGEVVGGTVRYDQDNLLLSFSVQDKDNQKISMPAVYKGVMPDAFKESEEVILEGTYNRHDNLFNATILLAKCPSKYEAADKGQEQASR